MCEREEGAKNTGNRVPYRGPEERKEQFITFYRFLSGFSLRTAKTLLKEPTPFHNKQKTLFSERGSKLVFFIENPMSIAQARLANPPRKIKARSRDRL